jgi:hypothetical protein
MQTAPRPTVHLCGRDVPRPGHVCAFFDSREEEYATLLPYLREGLDDGDEVINVLDAARLPDHRRRLTAAGIQERKDNISIGSSEETYFHEGRFEIERMVAFLQNRLIAAKAEGRRVRTAGWMDWIHREAPGTERAMEYEARVNRLVPSFDCTFMCVYDLARLNGGMVADILATHPWAIINGDIRQNPFFVPPDQYLSQVFARKRPAHAREA